MLVKRCTQNTSKHGKLSSIDRTGKFQFITVTKKGNTKECSNCHTIALISHDSKVMLKILQTRIQQYVNQELSDVQAEFRKGRGTRNLSTSTGSQKKQENAKKKELLLLH